MNQHLSSVDAVRAVADLSTRLGLQLSDSQMTWEAYEHVQATSEPWLVNHLVRSWIFGAQLAKRRGLEPDAELLAVAALFHDFGLVSNPNPDFRFEVVGANAARRFAEERGVNENGQRLIWDAVALHTTASIARHKEAEVVCCQIGISLDFGGLNYAELTQEEIDLVVAAFPRLNMKEQMKTCLCRIARERPQTTYDNAVAEFGQRFVQGYRKPFSVVDLLSDSPFSE